MKLHTLDYKRTSSGFEYTGIKYLENKSETKKEENKKEEIIIEDEKKEDIIKNEIKQNVNKKPLVIQKKKNIKNKTLRELDTDRSDSDE
jgi:hypothetical protein